MSAAIISRRYAEALLLAVQDANGSLDETLSALREWSDWLAAGSDAATALTSPVLAPDQQAALLGELIEQNGTDKLLGGFLRLCQSKRRLSLLGTMADAYEQKLRDLAGTITGEGVSAFPLDDETKNQIANKLAEILKQKPDLTWREDKGLVGGFKVQIGNTVWNASLQSQLDRLAETIRKGVR